MNAASLTRTGLTLAILSALAACAGGSGPDKSITNPSFFGGRVTAGTMTGDFNPAGFTTAQVRSLLSRTCTTRLTGFGTAPGEDGLTKFTASCSAWKTDARYVEYERIGGSNVLVEITGAQSGNLVFDKFETRV